MSYIYTYIIFYILEIIYFLCRYIIHIIILLNIKYIILFIHIICIYIVKGLCPLGLRVLVVYNGRVVLIIQST